MTFGSESEKHHLESEDWTQSKELANKIKSGEVKSNQFSNEQLDAIFKGKDKIPNYTWHHNQDTGRMQLIDEDIHRRTGHIGYEGMKNGK
ncbi:hypothetical protein BKK56_11665 [Rodentibacter genomosp. 2]|nr:hypothetical protein BKK56_11665 [Rodentibacter genomosp. 2]